jgi:hypothetical protein
VPPRDDEETWRDPSDDADEGGARDEKPSRGARFDEERWMRRLDTVLQRHRFPTRRSFERFLESERHEREAEELDDAMSIEEEAQELAYLALESVDDEAAENHARDAIALDPDCVDARVLLAFLVTDDLDERIWLLERAVDCGRWRYESAKTDDLRDHYLQRIEARPLQRALASLAETLIEAGEEDEAEKLYAESVELPGETEDANYAYVVFLLRFSRLVKARERIESLLTDDVGRAWCAILERFLSGERSEAEDLLHDARPRNFWVASYLTGEFDAKKAELAELSDEQDDALWVASALRPAFEAHPEALEWLRSRA